MHKFSAVVCLLVGLNLCWAKAPFVILIDPGHGGDDGGASANGLREKDITLEVALELEKLLKADALENFEIRFTRRSDKFLHIDKRKVIASNSKADLMISIHANSSPDPKASGTEIYFENQLATDEESMRLAARENADPVPTGETAGNALDKQQIGAILEDLAHNDHMVKSNLLAQNILGALAQHSERKSVKIRQAPFRVLLNNSPAALIELGYITNPKDAQWLKGKSNKEKIAFSLYNGIKTFRAKLANTQIKE